MPVLTVTLPEKSFVPTAASVGPQWKINGGVGWFEEEGWRGDTVTFG